MGNNHILVGGKIYFMFTLLSAWYRIIGHPRWFPQDKGSGEVCRDRVRCNISCNRPTLTAAIHCLQVGKSRNTQRRLHEQGIYKQVGRRHYDTKNV